VLRIRLALQWFGHVLQGWTGSGRTIWSAGDRMRAQMDARETVNTPVNAEGFPVAPAESPTVPGVRS
jgi:hypothetical protein